MSYSSQNDLKQMLVDRLQDCALIVLDAKGKVLNWNAGAIALLGYGEAQAVGQSFSWIASDPAEVPSALAFAHQNGRHEDICRRKHSSGADVEVREVVIPLLDPQRNPVGFGVMLQPLTNSRFTSDDASLEVGVGSDARQLALVSTPNATKVLVVDDDDAVRVVAVHLLEGLGYEVIEASSGKQALDRLERDTDIDVLFTDVVMPGMNGSELAERARLMRPGLKILFASGYFEHALVKNGRIAQNTNLLVKPYHEQTLAKKMQMTLRADSQDSVESP